MLIALAKCTRLRPAFGAGADNIIKENCAWVETEIGPVPYSN